MVKRTLQAALLVASALWAAGLAAQPARDGAVTVGTVSFPPDAPGVAGPVSALAPALSLRPRLREAWSAPALRWDAHPRAAAWSAAVMGALRGPGARLLEVVPQDIAAWCPAYPTAPRGQRAAFWAGLISVLAWHESTHRPRAVGGGGRWFGLVQIAPSTARYRDCAVGSGEALLDGPANLRCGVRIMATTVPRDGVVSRGMRGVAADWGPFHSRRKREDMRAWVRAQSYCRMPPRPAPRPEGFLADVMRPMTRPMTAAAPRPVARPQPVAALASAR
jgi:hypothetical protein